MTESLFDRTRRLVSAGVEGAMSTVERAGSGILMREAVRDVARQIDRLVGERDTARTRGVQVAARQTAIGKELGTLDEQARFALDKRRPDLAEQAVARQVELDAELALLSGAAAKADADGKRLDDAIADMRARHGRMQAEVAAFEAARDDASAPSSRAAKKVAGAEQAFERAMAASGGAGVRPANGEVAEIAALQKEAAIAARFAALRDASSAGEAPKPGRRAAR